MYIRKTLSNGLRVVLVPRASSDTMTAMILVRTGSADEPEKVAGISHLVEHMLGMGTVKRPSFFEVSDFIESIGGMNNAFTSKIYTGYYAKVAKEFWAESLDFLSDNFFNSLLLEDKIEREKAVIIEEIKMHDDIPTDLVAKNYSISSYGQTSLGREIAGSPESVGGITKNDLLEYVKDRYFPQNTVVVLAGNWETSNDNIFEEIEKSFQFKNSKNASFVFPKYEIKPERVNVQVKNSEQTNMLIGFNSPGMLDEDCIPLQLLMEIIGGGASSRMLQEIREKRGLAYDVRSGMSSYYGVGEMATIVGVANDKWEEAAKAVVEQYQLIADKGITQKELDRAKNMVKGSQLIHLEDTEELAWHFAEFELLYNKIITPNEFLAKYQAVEMADIERVIKKYIDIPNINFAGVGSKLNEQIVNNILNR